MAGSQFLEMVGNLARYHREHEKFYARAPLEEAASLQRTSTALRALAERWSTAKAKKPEVASPFSGAEDLNDERAIELAGILFMEGEGELAEIARIKGELRAASEDNAQAGEWLSSAMEASWGSQPGPGARHPRSARLLSHRGPRGPRRAKELPAPAARRLRHDRPRQRPRRAERRPRPRERATLAGVQGTGRGAGLSRRVTDLVARRVAVVQHQDVAVGVGEGDGGEVDAGDAE